MRLKHIQLQKNIALIIGKRIGEIMKKSILEMILFDDRIATCPSCKKQFDVTEEFRNEISMREFEISGLCQKCQDSVFGVD